MDIGRTKTENKTITDTAGVKETYTGSSPKQNTQAEFKEGQVVKGEIVDLRYDRVSIRLESQDRVVTGRLDGNVPLSIGQEAQFKVTQDQAEHLTLKYLPEDSKAAADSTAEMALTASNLPLSERNKAIALELLNHRMSVDTQSLQKLIKISLSNREAAPLTLVLMQKNNIPMTASNIQQFEAYQNGTHQLLNGIHTVIRNISELIGQPAFNHFQESLDQNRKLLDILTGGKNSGDIQTKTNQPLSSLLNTEELNLLSKALLQNLSEDTSLSAEAKAVLAKQLLDGTLTANTADQLILKLFEQDGKDPGKILMGQSQEMQAEELSNLLMSSDNPAAVDKAAAYEGLIGALSDVLLNGTDQAFAGMTGNEASQLIRHILEQLAPAPDQAAELKTVMTNGDNPSASTVQDAGTGLKSVLASDDRAILNELLKGFPGADGHQAAVADGSAGLKDILSMIKAGLPLQKQDAAAALLSSSQYQKLLSEAFHEKWTLPQDKLSDKASVTALYQNLQEDLDKLSELIKLGKDSEETFKLQEPVKNMQDNLEFLKNLNEVFTCLQLPVRFKEQDIHSDLYVFTKKDALKGRKEDLNVLLHLDMPNLGPVNIHLQMDHNQVTARFFPEETAAGRLISSYLPDLTAALQKKGYGFHAKVETAYEKPDFSKDFIEQNSADHNIMRYTFDIRT